MDDRLAPPLRDVRNLGQDIGDAEGQEQRRAGRRLAALELPMEKAALADCTDGLTRL